MIIGWKDDGQIVRMCSTIVIGVYFARDYSSVEVMAFSCPQSPGTFYGRVDEGTSLHSWYHVRWMACWKEGVKKRRGLMRNVYVVNGIMEGREENKLSNLKVHLFHGHPHNSRNDGLK